MAVVGSAKEKIATREKRISDAEHWYKRTYLVEVDDHKDDANVVETAFGLPKYGQNYITEKMIDVSVHVYSMNAKQINHRLWSVDIEYTNSSSKFNEPKDPTLYRPQWSWGGFQERKTVEGQSKWEEEYESQDPSDEGVLLWDSTGILNSAKEPFVPPAEIDNFIPTLTFKRNEPIFNHNYMLLYVNSVNKRRWYKWHPRTVKCASISGVYKEKQIRKKIYSYWEVTYVFHFKKETWDLFLLDQGTYYFDGGFSTVAYARKVPFGAKGTPALGLLTSDGDKSTTIAHYRRYRVLSELNFNRLMIPIIM